LNTSSWESYPPIIFSLKILVGSAALVHSIRGLQEYRVKRIPTLGFGLYYSLRAMSMLRTRWGDFVHAYNEIRTSARSLRVELRLISCLVTALFLESLLLSKSILMMIAARGGIPRNNDWQSSINSCRYVGIFSYRVIGDAVLLGLIVACAVWWEGLKNIVHF